MKKIFVLASTSLIVFSCSKSLKSSDNGNNDQGSNLSAIDIVQKNPSNQINPLPIKPDPELPKLYRELKFGSDGFVTLNSQTGEYKIEKLPTSKLDFDFVQPSKGMLDTIISDPIYFYRSSLFPVDKYSLFQIPDILEFDKTNSVDSQPSKDKNDVSMQFWGLLTNKVSFGYLVCFKSVENKYAKLDFIVEERDDLYSNPSCGMYKKLIDENKVKSLNLKGGDYILLRFYGFRFNTFGDCFDIKTCTTSYNTQIKYYIQNN